jgi:hypothetical protein
VVNALLTVAAFIWVYRRSIVELTGIGLVVLAAALWHPIVGILTGGIALVVAANFAGRS